MDEVFTDRDIALLIRGSKLESLIHHEGWGDFERILNHHINRLEKIVLDPLHSDTSRKEAEIKNYEDYRVKVRVIHHLKSIMRTIKRVIENKNDFLKKYEGGNNGER